MRVSLCHCGIEPDVFWLFPLWVITIVLRSCLCFSQAGFNWKNVFQTGFILGRFGNVFQLNKSWHKMRLWPFWVKISISLFTFGPFSHPSFCLPTLFQKGRILQWPSVQHPPPFQLPHLLMLSLLVYLYMSPYLLHSSISWRRTSQSHQTLSQSASVCAQTAWRLSSEPIFSPIGYHLMKLRMPVHPFIRSSSSYANSWSQLWDTWLFAKKVFLSKEMDVIIFAQATINGTDLCTKNVGPQMARRNPSCGPSKMSMKWSCWPKGGICFNDMIALLIRLEIGSSPLWGQTWQIKFSSAGGDLFQWYDRFVDPIGDWIEPALGPNLTNQILFRQNMRVSLCHCGIEPDVFWLFPLWVITIVLRSCLCFSQAGFNWKNSKVCPTQCEKPISVWTVSSMWTIHFNGNTEASSNTKIAKTNDSTNHSKVRP